MTEIPEDRAPTRRPESEPDLEERRRFLRQALRYGILGMGGVFLINDVTDGSLVDPLTDVVGDRDASSEDDCYCDYKCERCTCDRVECTKDECTSSCGTTCSCGENCAKDCKTSCSCQCSCRCVTPCKCSHQDTDYIMLWGATSTQGDKDFQRRLERAPLTQRTSSMLYAQAKITEKDEAVERIQNNSRGYVGQKKTNDAFASRDQDLINTVSEARRDDGGEESSGPLTIATRHALRKLFGG